MNVVIIKYNAGNIRSVLCALSRLGVTATVTDDPALIRSADRVIFPGVGEASTAMAYLKEKGLDEVILSLTQPFLGICLGMQLMCAHSEEHDADCLGIFGIPVVKFPEHEGVKIPQVGWNTVTFRRDCPLFAGLEQDWCYFVHSYYAPKCAYSVALTEYDGVVFSSALRKGQLLWLPVPSGEELPGRRCDSEKLSGRCVMDLIPAIDLIGGRCVRLSQGDYQRKTEYGDPVEIAKTYEGAGIRRLHLVDLDGAKGNGIVNLAVLSRIAKETRLVIDFGGGVKDEEQLQAGVRRRGCDGHLWFHCGGAAGSGVRVERTLRFCPPDHRL
jgi:glutamine amidotransferase